MKIKIFKDIKFIIGENAQDNWNILNDALKENIYYIWFHLNSFPSCYVIMYSSLDCLENKEEYLIYGSKLCKENTKYRHINNIKICFTTLNKLQKTDKIGEVLVKGKKNIIKL